MLDLVKKRFQYLDSLRGIAAVLVVIFHSKGCVPFNSFLNNNRVIFFANAMVDFFFVLSGFVITHAYKDRLANFRDVAVFQFNRLVRVYPVHLIFLLFYLAQEMMRYLQVNYMGAQFGEVPFSRNTPDALIKQLLLVHSFLHDKLTFNSPSWSISSEFYIYAIFALLALTAGRYLAWIAACVALLGGTMVFATGAVDGHVGVEVMYRTSYGFFLGVLVYFIASRTSLQVPGLVVDGVVIFTIVAYLYPEVVHRVALTLLFALVIFLLVSSGRSMSKIVLSAAPLIFLGDISYSIYMSHTAIWYTMSRVFRYLLGVPMTSDEYGNRFLDTSPTMTTILLFVGLGITIAVSAFLFRFVERPSQQRLRMKRQPPTPKSSVPPPVAVREAGSA